MNMVFMVIPIADEVTGAEKFNIKLMPASFGVDPGESVTLANGDVLRGVLEQIAAPSIVEERWMPFVRTRQTFAIKSTREDWDKLMHWIEAQLLLPRT